MANIVKTKQIQKVLNTLLFLKKRWICLLDLLSFIFLVYVFSQNLNHTILAYIFYTIASYTLVVTVISLFELTAGIRKFAFGNSYISRYYSDIQFRMKIKLYFSVSINLSYAILKLIIGGVYRSIWDAHLGTYYIIICIVRCILLKQINYNELGNNKLIEYKNYRLCSYFVIALNIMFTGIVVLMVYKNYTYQYPGYLIYIAAMYTFYTAISAVYNIIKFNKYNSPLLNAINIICFITALVSILGLQTAMLAQFGTEPILEKQRFIGLTGAIICTMIFIVSIYMNLHARTEIGKLTSAS